MSTSCEPDSPQPSKAARPDSPQLSSVFALLLGTSIIAFVMGSLVTEFQYCPYPQFLKPAYEAGRAFYRQWALTSSLRETDLWFATRFKQRGVVRHDPEKCFDGYTLYTSGHDSAAFLIDMDGRVLHRWRVPFHSLWDQPPHIDRPVPERFIHWRRAHLFPNGDLIALYEAAGDTPWGYGLVKVDRDSNVIWKLAENVHHDFYVRPDNSIVALAHQWRDSWSHSFQGGKQFGRVVMDDVVLVLSPEGKVLQRISLLDAIANSDYTHLLSTVAVPRWDVLHTNTVELITPEFAQHHDFCRPEQIMLSFRSQNAIAVLDLESKQIVWASCGPYRAQHDPDVLPNGRILLFDNLGNPGPGGPSRVIELDPESQAIDWSYEGSPDNPLNSSVRSVQQLLPNGNVLITESDGGRILEVTREKEVVWEFRNPESLPDGPPSIAIVCGATRLPSDTIKFKLNKGGK